MAEPRNPNQEEDDEDWLQAQDWICETCGKTERFDTSEEAITAGWNFAAGDICPQCHAENIKWRRTHGKF